MSTVSEICDAIGRQKIAQAVGVKPTAVSNAVAEARFPAKWFIVLSGMCQEIGLDCPADLFAFTASSAPAADQTEGDAA
jgi:hypothetical protein